MIPFKMVQIHAIYRSKHPQSVLHQQEKWRITHVTSSLMQDTKPQHITRHLSHIHSIARAPITMATTVQRISTHLYLSNLLFISRSCLCYQLCRHGFGSHGNLSIHPLSLIRLLKFTLMACLFSRDLCIFLNVKYYRIWMGSKLLHEF